MNKFLPLLLCPILSVSSLNAMTLHLEMTPELTGTNGLVMKKLDSKRIRFTIPFSPTEQGGDTRYPMVRAGTLEIYGNEGLEMRCPVEPRKVAGGKLEYRFELADPSARRAVFTLNEFRDDGQVGGGKVYSYRLARFIDPQQQQREMVREIERNGAEMLKTLMERIAPPSPN